MNYLIIQINQLVIVTRFQLNMASFEKPPPSKRKAASPQHWSLGLQASMGDPELLVRSDETIVAIKDKFPKAKYHFLVLPKEEISSLRSLNKSHVGLLRDMLKCGEQIAAEAIAKGDSKTKVTFRYGFHAVPSMARLHMHAISQDFDSPCLKNKKHWNSFTTNFFVDAVDVIDLLDSKGKVDFNKAKYESLLKEPLKCHICGTGLENMPSLKAHIQQHC